MILQGDCREVLRTLEAGSVQACVTSPPYWGLRDYGLPPQTWGGDSDCEHEWGEDLRVHRGGPQGSSTAFVGRTANGARDATKDIPAGAFCQRCGAWRGNLGLEPTPELYVEHIVEVFREVARVLRPDGTLWLNLGDSFFGGKGQNGNTKARATAKDRGFTQSGGTVTMTTRPQDRPHPILKPKDLVGIPWRCAFALQADGWYLRSAIVWHKPNPMPESVRDRPTSAYEHVFLLAKSQRYFYDADGIAEPAGYAHEAKWDNGENGHGGGVSHKGQGSSTRKFRKSGNKERKYGESADRPGSEIGRSVPWEGTTRNARNVWTITTRPFPEAHFATFPPELARRCILAGSREGDVILDPFGGSGTTKMVAEKLGRRAVIIELNPDYIQIAERRTAQRTLWAAGGER